MITLTELAQKLGTSNRQTRKLIQNITRYTPEKVIIYKKIEKETFYDFDLVVKWIQKLKNIS